MAAKIVKALLMVMVLVNRDRNAGRHRPMTQSAGPERVEIDGNRLIHEKSPYLLQHAHNPVNWYPWGDEAFEEAHRMDKPVFLSIGYSTCHWCHVMEKESFEDPEVAGLLNQTFVSIKVDREERPDLDHVYMTVCQMVTGSGGWPLTIVMTPDKRPFFAGTYIPKGSRFGRTGMMELIPRIGELWRTRREEVLASAEGITRTLRGLDQEGRGARLDRSVMDRAYEELSRRFDETYGGFGNTPKFPTPHNLLFLLRYWSRTGKSEALGMVEKTLQEMRWGGIFDQIGFGFHRYSTDREWLVPHFEKMLYDQAMLALAYLETYQATGKEVYADTAREIFRYVLRDMTAPQGGFYSAEDADSEGVEGKFYVWTREELHRVLGEEAANLTAKVAHVARNGNYREEATGKNTGANILYFGKPISEIAADLGMGREDLERAFESARRRLFDARERRVHPHKDDKVLTDWTGLMMAALAKGAQILGSETYAEAAEAAAGFVLSRLRKPDGRLLHRYRDGEAAIPAHLDDYAFLVWGLIELYEATFDASYLKTAVDLNADMVDHFWDEEGGGLFFTPDDGERLIVRRKEVYDGAIPSGNAVALLNLLRLGRLTGRAELEEKAAAISRAFSAQIGQAPSGYTHFLSAVDFGIGPSYEIVVSGPSASRETESMIEALRGRYLPTCIIILRPSDQESPGITSLAPYTEQQLPLEGKPTVYLCKGNTCEAPSTDIGKVLASIASRPS